MNDLEYLEPLVIETQKLLLAKGITMTLDQIMVVILAFLEIENESYR